jgi:hypothetical protein
MAKKIPCEVYSRVVGYFARVSNWNEGKREEFKDRVAFDMRASLAHPDKREAEMLEHLVEEGVLAAPRIVEVLA